MRPEFHFTADAGWINDPHGIRHHGGRYHVFFQQVPGRTDWARDVHWGHAVGDDLLSLRQLPIAISPGEGDGGIWTGSLVVDDAGDARIFYTSTDLPTLDHGRIRTATPRDDDWIAWRKGDVVAETPAGMSVFRDPWVFRDGSGWSMVVGGRHDDGAAAIVSYRSDDLQTWSYGGLALRPAEDPDTALARNTLWECPQLFEIDGRHVLVLSVEDPGEPRYVGYAVGCWRDGRFDAEAWGRLSFSRSPYAPTFFPDAVGRPSLVFWLSETAGEDWAGTLSIPYLLSLDGDALTLEPHPDLLRHRRPQSGPAVDAPAVDIEWSPSEGDALTIDGTAGALVALRIDGDEVQVETAVQTSRMPLAGVVRIIIDGPVLEVTTGLGVFGALVAPGSRLTVGGDLDGASIHPLVRA